MQAHLQHGNPDQQTHQDEQVNCFLHIIQQNFEHFNLETVLHVMDMFFCIQIEGQSEQTVLEKCSSKCKRTVNLLISNKDFILDKNLDFVPNCLPFANNVHSHSVAECEIIIDVLVYKIKHYRRSQSGILNLSDYQLSDAESEVLEKGLNYCPTPQGVDLGQLNLELDRFCRSVKLSLFFNGSCDPSEGEASGQSEDSVPFSHPDMKKA